MNSARALVHLGDLRPLPARIRLEPIAAVDGQRTWTDDVRHHHFVTFDAPAEKNTAGLERGHAVRFRNQLGDDVVKDPQPAGL